MPTRLEFFTGCGAALLAPSLEGSPIDWSFPGVVAAYARRLTDEAPFVQHDAGVVMPAASVVKLLILLAAARQVEERGWSWDHDLVLRSSEVVAGSESFGLDRGGERATLGSLAGAMIERSDNTAANALVDWLGFERIDAMGELAGMRQTRMRRHFMDFDARARGIENTTTAADMGVLTFGIARGCRLGFAGVSAADCRKIVGLMLAQEDRATIPAAISRGVAVANKTGELRDVRHDVAIVGVGGSNEYVLALLSSGITDRHAAFRRLRELAANIDRLERAGYFQTALATRSRLRPRIFSSSASE